MGFNGLVGFAWLVGVSVGRWLGGMVRVSFVALFGGWPIDTREPLDFRRFRAHENEIIRVL